MSAFNRLDAAYLLLCNHIAALRPMRRMGGFLGSKSYAVQISPQNRGVRQEADRELAARKSFPNRITRQQRRFTERRERAA